ncbi:MAG: hypothetical protein PVJ80_12435 [Gemmatimonadota bacterium]|jgi:hypothetical protein
MARIASVAGAVFTAVGILAPRPALAQATAHDHAADHAHSHANAVVSCTDLAAPPWNGLPDADREEVARLQTELSALSTPEAAMAAGFRPALGDIPGMGVHYVNSQRMQDGIHLDAPDHLLFAKIDGKDQLVGTAYAFRDVPDTDEPIPFRSDLAHWHDHPQFAPPGQTLHMLHVWFIPSSNGPFAGLNFWLPFRSAGITPPSACWMADEADAQRIQRVSFALAPRDWGSDGATVQQADVSAERTGILTDLDAAAKAGDHDAWMAAADRFINDLSPAELAQVEATLRALTMAQMSTSERETQN